MKLTTDQVIELIDFIREADAHNPGLGSVEIYGSGEQLRCADENGEDPYYNVAGMCYVDDSGEVKSIVFRDTTLRQCHRLMTEVADRII
jgi:hypothetical protein